MNFIFKNNQTKIVRETPKLVTFSTCWYILKSKFSANIYCKWISNLLSIVKNFNLVIYTNTESYEYLLPLIDSSNTNIKVIFKPMEEFYTYKYKGHWIKNHEKSNTQHTRGRCTRIVGLSVGHNQLRHGRCLLRN